jgi:hypothetical protein
MGKTSSGVRTDFLDGLLGYNARRTSLHLVSSFVRDLADLQLKPVGFSLLCLVGHNPGITSRQLCQTLDIQPPNLVGSAARRKRHDGFYGLVGVGLGVG